MAVFEVVLRDAAGRGEAFDVADREHGRVAHEREQLHRRVSRHTGDVDDMAGARQRRRADDRDDRDGVTGDTAAFDFPLQGVADRAVADDTDVQRGARRQGFSRPLGEQREAIDVGSLEGGLGHVLSRNRHPHQEDQDD